MSVSRSSTSVVAEPRVNSIEARQARWSPRPAPENPSLAVVRPPGQVFADLLLLGALACQAPVALLSVPQGDGAWATLSHGLDEREGRNNAQLFEAIAASTEPVEIADLAATLPRSPLAMPPHALRWAYGVALRNPYGEVIGVVAVLDRWMRPLTKREPRAMVSLARQLGAQLAHRSAPAAVAPPSGPAPQPGANGHQGSPLEGHRPSPPANLVTPRQPLLRSHEVAKMFDVTERTVLNWAAAGKLPSTRTMGGHWRFRRDDVVSLLASASSGPGA